MYWTLSKMVAPTPIVVRPNMHAFKTIIVVVTITLGWASTAAAAPAVHELPPERADVEPKQFRLRTGSLGVGAAWRPELWAGPGGVCGYNPLCGFSPWVGFDFELGSRTVRLVAGTYHAPVPTFSGDLVSLEAFMADVGVLFGGPRVRAGIVGNAGAINLGGAVILRLSPWGDRHGHRHGMDFRVATSALQPLGLVVSYRFYPRKLDRQYPQRPSTREPRR